MTPLFPPELIDAEAGCSPCVHALFHQPWWLDAVAPGRWGVVEITRGSQIAARMPFVMEMRWGLRAIRNPVLTQTLGPWLRASPAKYGNRLGEEKQLIGELIEQLPAAHFCSIACHHSVTNVLPFHWAGFDITVRFTYRLPDLSNIDALWDGLLESARREIRKAESTIAVRDDLDLDRFWAVNELTFHRQGTRPPYSRELFERLDASLARRNARKRLYAVDRQGRVHAVLFLVWDAASAYYLAGGADPRLRTSGASSLLMWHAIQHAAGVTRAFDFEGSMLEPVERFFRSFGAQQTPYYLATRATRIVRLLSAARPRIQRLPRRSR